MRRTFRYQLRPTARQAVALAACLEDHRVLYNAALEHRRTAYRQAGVAGRYGEQSGDLKHIRRADPDLARWSFSSQQATLRRLDKAFAAFFRRVKAREAPGYPRFKGRGWFDTVEWPKNSDGCKWVTTDERSPRVYLQGVGHVKVNQHRVPLGTVKTISVKRAGRRWYLVLSCDDVPAEPLQPTGAITGIDLGVVSFLTTSEGVHVPNPRHLTRVADKLADARRALSRCKRGSNRRRNTRDRVARLHGKVRRQRLDLAHKTARELVNRHDVIVHEALRIKNMTRSARGTVEQPGSNVRQKTGLNRSILDAGWGAFLAVLAHKAESAGRQVIAVEPPNTSRTCPECGHVSGDNRPTQAEFRCVACRHVGHADVIAATNILRAGLARHAADAA